TVYNGPPVQTGGGTVYNGPASGAGGTVYNGPATGGTTYNPTPQGAPAGAKPATPPQMGGIGNIFFLIAGLSLLNTVLAIAGANFALALGLGITRAFDSSF